ncbi:MAG TPA: GGDEF domain-containing protein [Aquabacterium sp.]|uniref:GGDEF domain-containing protein n=1 Tax=Aquabacterium sp. TaxID=1872578 RepID=UPI002E363F83|nr:GGDEF domain-containing protein [Aquabacterium sp.]HEX5372209.1 GGDEF domain-containing protein [Aquabacterium sp.]
MTPSFGAWLDLGCDRTADPTQKRKIRNVNATTYVVLVAYALYHAANLALGEAGLVLATWAITPFYFSIAAVPWLNHRGLHGLARWVLSLSVTLTMLCTMLLVAGSWFGLHFYFISVIVVTPMFFSLEQWRSMVSIFVLNASLFFYFEYVGVTPHPLILSTTPATIEFLRISHTCTSLLTVLVISFARDRGASQNEESFEELSSIDMLTGLPNRRRMLQRIRESIAMGKRTKEHSALLFLDLDNFKSLNDQHGHATGDLLLKEVARRLRACLREIDVEARFGGDEFVILLNMLGPDVAAARENTRRVADKVRASLAEPYHLVVSPRGSAQDQVVHHCTASVGALVFQANSLPPEELLKLADAAMYQAKEQGRNTVCLSERTVA